MEEKTLESRLDASQAAQERTRLAFFATTIISLAMLSAGWNAYLSFYRDVAFDLADLTEATKTSDGVANRLGVQELQKQTLREWASSRMINVSLLGIRVGIDDAPTVGAVALLVSLIWFYLSIRRENYVIGFLLYDYKDSKYSLEAKWRVYHGINSYSVFTLVRFSDTPFCTIHNIPENNQLKFLRPIMGILYYLPIITILFLIFLDVWSVFRVSPLRGDNRILFNHLWEQTKYNELGWIVVWWLVGLVLAIPVGDLCKRIRTFASGTESALREFLKLIEHESEEIRTRSLVSTHQLVLPRHLEPNLQTDSGNMKGTQNETHSSQNVLPILSDNVVDGVVKKSANDDKAT